MIATNEALDVLRHGWLDAATSLAPDVPEIAQLLNARLEIAISSDGLDERHLLEAIEDVEKVTARPGEVSGSALSRRLRRTVYEYLLALDAVHVVETSPVFIAARKAASAGQMIGAEEIAALVYASVEPLDRLADDDGAEAAAPGFDEDPESLLDDPTTAETRGARRRFGLRLRHRRPNEAWAGPLSEEAAFAATEIEPPSLDPALNGSQTAAVQTAGEESGPVDSTAVPAGAVALPDDGDAAFVADAASSNGEADPQSGTSTVADAPAPLDSAAGADEPAEDVAPEAAEHGEAASGLVVPEGTQVPAGSPAPPEDVAVPPPLFSLAEAEAIRSSEDNADLDPPSDTSEHGIDLSGAPATPAEPPATVAETEASPESDAGEPVAPHQFVAPRAGFHIVDDDDDLRGVHQAPMRIPTFGDDEAPADEDRDTASGDAGKTAAGTPDPATGAVELSAAGADEAAATGEAEPAPTGDAEPDTDVTDEGAAAVIAEPPDAGTGEPLDSGTDEPPATRPLADSSTEFLPWDAHAAAAPPTAEPGMAGPDAGSEAAPAGAPAPDATPPPPPFVRAQTTPFSPLNGPADEAAWITRVVAVAPESEHEDANRGWRVRDNRPGTRHRTAASAAAAPDVEDDPFGINPKLADLRRRIEDRLRRKRCDEAAALLQALAQDTGGRAVADLAMNAGDRCRTLGKSNAALNCYLAASRSDPVYEQPLGRLADVCLDAQETDLAVTYLERIARLYRFRGDEKEALRVYRRIAAVAPYREDVLAILLNAQRTGRLD